MAEDTLYLQLHKLSAVNSEEVLEQILTTLWKTRRSGLRPPDKSRIQSLLSLPSLPELDPKYASQWKEEIAKEQVKASAPPSFTPLPSSDIPTSLWPRQDDPIARINLSDFGASTPIIADAAGSCRAPLLIQQDAGPPDNLEVLPRLKSMTWTMENLNSAPANRVAIIHLKLQDYSKSPSGEIEVKFQLTKDTLEAMLRSMTYISEQLSNMVRMPFCILLWTLWSLRRVWRVRNSVFGS
ncbi:protein FAR1-RELATED SEQUENCE 3-like isoform X5 [Durio zibethinus]|uniref:Protein FAR1-RELATED SEQUENCE 3-like isoform X5 n=1 Tax=Durio zibethinus TaxID=66656 RepID=A0A6P5Z4K1_DURZI|nr:protein FAR1-RELATED SEQUENCE 3-like isoform X5 [Durio zibethinus]